MVTGNPVVYDTLRGPMAADAIEAVTDPHFAQLLASAMSVTNADRLPPAALMAEWAVRCTYTDGLSNSAPETDLFCADVESLLVAALGDVNQASMKRFVFAAEQWMTSGRRVQNGLWPDVDVEYAECAEDCNAMRAALVPEVDANGGNKERLKALGQLRERGRALLTSARFVLPR